MTAVADAGGDAVNAGEFSYFHQFTFPLAAPRFRHQRAVLSPQQPSSWRKHHTWKEGEALCERN
jgi:hypothetical protein